MALKNRCLLYDMTKAGRSQVRSGINRVSRSLFAELKGIEGDHYEVIGVEWCRKKGRFVALDEGENEKVYSAQLDPLSTFITVDVFEPIERQGFEMWLLDSQIQKGIIFHDAIPLTHPQITWPHSVARHPFYLEMLSKFDAVFSVSDTAQDDLSHYFEFLRVVDPPKLRRVYLGADFTSESRQEIEDVSRVFTLLMVGILEPRKNQALLLEVTKDLWNEGEIEFHLNIIGRVNPHFGKPIVKQIKKLKRLGYSVSYEKAVSDYEMGRLYAKTDLLVFPSITEGCGLPVLESVARGIPVLASDIGPVKENAEGGGVHLFQSENFESLRTELKKIIGSPDHYTKLRSEAEERKVFTWKDTADHLLNTLKSL